MGNASLAALKEETLQKTALGALVFVFALAGCGGGGPSSSAPSTHSGRGDSVAADDLVNPLEEITDPSDQRFVAEKVDPILDKEGVGAETFRVDLTRGTKSVRAYVACAPASRFRVTIGKSFSGACAPRFQNYADIPPGSASKVKLDLPASTKFSILVIPSPTN